MNKFIISLILLTNSAFAQSKVEIVALTILGEARGEEKIGMLAVANVIQNRSFLTGKCADKVCLQKYQFSMWNKGLNRKEMKKLLKCPQAPYAIKLAKLICGKRELKDVTGGATHYCRTDCYPEWAVKDCLTVTIKSHKFYKI